MFSKLVFVFLFFLFHSGHLFAVERVNQLVLSDYYLSYTLSQKGLYDKALTYTKRAAYKGYAPAQYNLGLSYLHGLGIEKDVKYAIVWLEKSAQQDLADAQTELAMAYYLGRGVKKDNQKAKYYWTLAASQNDEYAQFNLASLSIENGKTHQAKIWLIKAMHNQHPNAKLALSQLESMNQSLKKAKNPAF